jgi:hypothetical protein
MNLNYEWMKFYEAAVLETSSEALPHRIELPKTPSVSAWLPLQVTKRKDAPSSRRSTYWALLSVNDDLSMSAITVWICMTPSIPRTRKLSWQRPG